jgi:hypothetical protein
VTSPLRDGPPGTAGGRDWGTALRQIAGAGPAAVAA